MDEPNTVITTDASLQGWGAHEGNNITGGRWQVSEADDHINVLELNAIYLGLQSLVKKPNKQVRILTNNTTAMAYIRRMGGTRSLRCNEVAKLIWAWAETNNNWLTVAHISGKSNTIADSASRHFKDHLEWELNGSIFKSICKVWGSPQIDLFASRNNFKIPKYVSWHPEPYSWKVDAFSFKWTDYFFYVFPPFRMVGRVALKLLLDRSRAILIAPEWPTQPWFAALNHWASAQLRFPRGPDNLRHQGPLQKRGDVSTTPLVAFLFSGKV